MPVNDNGNRNGARKPIDHLRAFVASVLEPERKKEEVPQEQQPKKPFRGRDTTQSSGEDRTVKFVLAGVGGVVVLVLMILGLSQKHVAKKPKGDAPAIGQVQQAPADGGNTRTTSIVPQASMQPAPAEDGKRGKLTAQDLENAADQPSRPPALAKPAPKSDAKTLGQIAPFNAGQSSSDNWSPKPYSGQPERTNATEEKAANTALAKPSLVFVASVATAASPSVESSLLTPSLDLGAGARLSARFNHIVTTAVDLPVVADIEYSYQRDGEIIVPAGTQAVGHIQQADRSGYVLIKFDRLEIPHRGEVPIDAVATNRNLGPIKGKVSGTHTGRNFLVRSFTDIGSGLAMFAGQSNTSGAISENDLLRSQLAQNVGNAGDQQIMQLMLTEHAVVTVPAGTDIFVVFEKTDSKPASGGKTATSGIPSQPSMNELRQLLELQREFHQPQSSSADTQ